MSLGDDADEIFRSAGRLVARILKGESPSTIALQPSSKPELIINMKAAKDLGVTVAPSVLKKATRVIQ
jgi:putative ABC transport system substrate-binding protein